MEDYINSLLFIVGLLVYFRNPKYVPIYYLLWPTFIIYILSIIEPFQLSVANQSFSTAMNYIWFCAFLAFIMYYKKLNKSEIVVYILLGVFLLYIYLLGHSRGGLQQFQSWARGYFCFVPLWLLIKFKNISYKDFRNYVFVVFSIQIFLGYSQLLFGVFYASFTNGRFAENGTLNITGTFARYNAFSDHISLLILSAIYILNKNKESMSNHKKHIICLMIIMGYLLVMMAGARTELFALSLTIILFIYLNFPKSKKLLILLGASYVLLYISGVTLSLKDESSDQNNYNRQKQLFDMINGKSDVTEESTLFYSVLLLEDYISQPSKMLTGPGRLFTTKYGYQGKITSTNAAWDSFLALLLCETGVIGYFFLILFLYLIIKNSKEKKTSIPFLIYLLIVSSTDEGLFRGTGAIFLLFSVYYSSFDFNTTCKLCLKKHKV